MQNLDPILFQPSVIPLTSTSTSHETQLQSKSILDNKIEFSEDIDLQTLLVNTNLNYSATGSSYEGFNVPHAAAVYADVFTRIRDGKGVFAKSESMPPDLIDLVNILKESKTSKYDPDNAKKMMESVQKLKIGESTAMVGGYYKIILGHTIIYRFKRTGQKTYDVYLYDAPRNTHQINGGKEKEGNEKTGRMQTRPYLLFRDVTPEELFFDSNPILFENLLKLLDLNYCPPNCTHDNVDNCFAHLSHRLVRGDELPKLFISEQSSGNCTIKTFNCLTLDYAGSHAAYKPISLDVRLAILIASYHHYKDHQDKIKYVSCFLFQLQSAANNFLNILNENYKKIDSPIGDEAYTTGCATAIHLTTEVAKLLQKVDSEPKPTLPMEATYVQKEELERVQQRQLNVAKIAKELDIQSTKAEPKTSKPLNPDLGVNATWKTLGSVLPQFNDLDPAKKRDTMLQVEATMRNLSHLKYQPVDLDEEECKLVANYLNNVQVFYTKIAFEMNEVGFPASHNTIMEAFALGYLLIVGADKKYGILEQYGVFTQHFFDFPRKDRLYTIQDTELLKQRNELETFFNKLFYDKPLIFNFENMQWDKLMILKGKCPEGALFREYIDKSQEIRDDLCAIAPSDSPQDPKMKAMYGAYTQLTGQAEFPKSLSHVRKLFDLVAQACEASHLGLLTSDNSNVHNTSNVLYSDSFCSIMTKNYRWTPFTQAVGDQRFDVGLKDFSPKGQLKDYIGDRQSGHGIVGKEAILPENELLVSESLMEGKDENDFYLALTEPTVQTTRLLNATEDHLDLLAVSQSPLYGEDSVTPPELPRFHTLLEHMFMKLVEDKDGVFFSPFMDSLKDPSYLNRFEHLVEVGIKCFIKSKPEGKPALDEMLFLVRLYGRALQTARAHNPQSPCSEKTLTLVTDLLSFLNKTLQLPDINKRGKLEVSLAIMGLLLGTPLKQLTPALQADLFISSGVLKHSMQQRTICSDPSFVRECQRTYFRLRQQCQEVLTDQKARDQFANGLLNKVLKGNDFNLSWEYKDGIYLTATDAANETWRMDLDELTIENSKGPLLQKEGKLNNTASLKRLFNKTKYQLSQFKEETWFQDPIWGQIKVVNSGNQEVIQRKINDSWYTYIPCELQYQPSLHLNQALFYDHALWLDPKNPQHILGYDLETGQLAYVIDKGICTHAITKKRFCPFPDDKRTQLIQLFESFSHISVWIDPKLESQETGNDTLEFSRFRREGGGLFHLQWDSDKKVWVYPHNPEFIIDANFNMPLHITNFLPLINEKTGQRKILIPARDFRSGGYNQSAYQLNLTSAGDGQRGALEFFEYDLSTQGELIPNSLESKVYLAQLYLAQKRYQQALTIIQTISLSDDVSDTTLKSVNVLLRSARSFMDHSPNACAIRLHVYHLFKKISPFTDLVEKPFDHMSSIYLTYLAGLNHIEHPLKLDREQEKELIDFLLNSINNSQEYSIDDKSTIEERRKFLCDGKLITKTILLGMRYSNRSWIEPPIQNIYFESERDKQQIAANEFFIDIAYKDIKARFLDKFDDFKRCYDALKNTKSIKDPVAQRLLYTLFLNVQEVHPTRLNILAIVSYCPRAVPALPSSDATLEEKLHWYNEMWRVYIDYYFYNRPIGHVTLDLYPSISLKNTSTIQGPSRQLLPPPPSQFIVDLQEDFQHWQKQFLEPQSKSIVSEPTRSQKKPPANQIEKHIRYYENDCEVAEQNTLKKQVFRTDVDFDILIKVLKESHQGALEIEERLLKKITKQMKSTAKDFLPFVQQQAIKLGESRPDPTLETILRAAASQQYARELKRLNSHLSDEEIEEVHTDCIAYMVQLTRKCHLERIFQPLEKWLKSERKNQTYLEEAQEAMSEERTYDPKKNTFLLLFESLSGWRVKPKQAAMIRLALSHILESKDDPDGVLFQQSMGGGKNSVIFSVLLDVLSEKYLSYMMCHNSQFTSVKGNTAAYQSRFGKEVYVLDYSIRDLSKPEILDLILKRLHEAKRRRCPVISKAAFPQVLESKMIVESLRLSDDDPDKCEKLMLLITKLQEINSLLVDIGAAIYDESHINLSIMSDVNIPIGNPKNIKPERAHLVKKIFEIMTEDTMRELIGFEKNLQSELSQNDYNNKFLPFVSDQLFDYPPLKLKDRPELKQAYIRFISGKIPPADQKLADQANPDLSLLDNEHKDNVLFLQHVANLYRSSNRYEQEAAHLIGLSRRMLDKVLRISLSNSFNRSYGRDVGYDDGRVKPYLAGEQADTTFGNMYLNLAYEFQSALNKEISEGELTFLAKKMTEAAHFYANKEGKPFEKTLEAQQFFELTQVKLENSNNPDQMKKALAYVNDKNHLKRRLDVESEVAPFHVRYHRQRVTSNSINKTSQFKKVISGSGTIWNAKTHSKKLSKVAYEEGVAGDIINTMTRRAKDTPKTWIHEVAKVDLESFKEVIRNHPNKKNFRGIFDAAGAFRDYNPADIAQQLLQFFAEEEKNGGPEIDTLIYAHQFSKKEIEKGSPKESFVLLKRGETKPIILKNTTKEELAKHQVNIDKLFGLLLEPKTTSTDITFADEALFLNTVDHKMPMYAALQSFRRSRKLFRGQRVELVVSSKARKEMLNEGATFTDIKDTLIANEALLLEEQINRAWLAQIEDVFRSAILKELRDAVDENKLMHLVHQYEGFLLDKFEDNPYEQSGRILGKGNALKILTDYKDRLLEKFIKTKSPSIDAVKSKLDTLFKQFNDEIEPDEQMDLTFDEDFNTTLEMEQEEQVQLELMQENQIQLLTELKQYDYKANSNPRAERTWNLDADSEIWPQLVQDLFTIPTVLKSKYKNKISTAAFAPCFPDNFWMTDNFRYTIQEDVPIFHPCSKQPGFILVVDKDKEGPQFILVSEKDAAYFKQWIGDKSPKGVYLIDMKGKAEVNSQSLDGKSTEFMKGLWTANLFAGNIEFLETHYDLSKQFIDDHPHLIDTMKQFLLLRTKNNRRKLAKLDKNRLFDFRNSAKLSLHDDEILFSSRRKEIETNYFRIRQLDQDGVAELPTDKVADLAPEQIKWLKTQEQIEALPNRLIDNMVPAQLPLLPKNRIRYLRNKILIQSLQGDDCKEFVDEQLKLIHPNQIPWITDAKLDQVPDSVLQRVTDGTQIKRFKNKRLTAFAEHQLCYIEPDDIKNLTESQVSLLAIKKHIERVPVEKAHCIKPACRKFIISLEALLTLPDGKELTQQQKNQLISHFSTSSIDEQKLKPWYIPFLPEDRLSSLSRPELICAIPTPSASKITQEQAKHLTRKQARLISGLEYPAFLGLDVTLSDLLNEKQVPKLDGTQQADRKFIEKLNAAQAHDLADDSLQHISPNIVKDLEKTDVIRLKEPQLLLKLDDVDENQKGILTKHFETVHSEQEISNIADRFLRFIPISATPRVPANRVLHLTDKHWTLVSKDTVKKIYQDMSIMITTSFIGSLNNQALEAVPPRHAVWLNKKQISELGNEHKTLVQGLQSPDSLSDLSDSAIQLLQPSQMNVLHDADFKRIAEPSLLLTASSSDKRLTDMQKRILTDTVLAQDPNQVADMHLPLITDLQVTKLTNPRKILALPTDKISQIQKHQVAGIASYDLTISFVQKLSTPALTALNDPKYRSFYQYLPPRQLSQLDASHAPMIQQLNTHQLSNLSDTALQEISPEQVPDLITADLNRLRRRELLLAIPENRMWELNDQTLDLYKQAVNALADVNLLKSHHLVHLQPNNPIVKLLPATLIESITPFPMPLIPHLPTDKIRYLRNDAANINQVPKHLQVHLTNDQLRTVYGPQFGSRRDQVLRGIAHTVILVPRLILQFVFNMIALVSTVFLALFSETMRQKVKLAAAETFVHAPARAFAGPTLIFDYVIYQRVHLAHSQDKWT